MGISCTAMRANSKPKMVFSNLSQLIAIPYKQAERVATALFTKWLCRHGLPNDIISDGRKEFCNEMVNKTLHKPFLAGLQNVVSNIHKPISITPIQETQLFNPKTSHLIKNQLPKSSKAKRDIAKMSIQLQSRPKKV